MTSSEIWLAGLAVSVLVGQGGIVRWTMLRMREDRDACSTRDAELHHRINEVKDDYVRRDDLMTHIARLETGQTAINTGLERLHERLDRIIVAGGILPAPKTGT